MDDTRIWDAVRGFIRSTKGGFIMGQDAVSHGHSMLRDFFGKKSWFEVMLLHALGRMPSRELSQWLESVYVGLSYPDPRIWCNAAGSYAGTLRTPTIAAVCAGALVSDSLMYGSASVIDSILPDFERLFAAAQAGRPIDEVLSEYLDAKRRAGKKPAVPGFSRPLVNGDERIEPARALAKALGFIPGPYETFAYALDDACRRANGEQMNYGAYHQAFLRDQGFTREEMMRTGSLMTSAGVIACYVEAYDNPPEAFLPLRCDDIRYEGRPARPAPRKR